MGIPFVDLKAQYLSIKEEIDSAVNQVIAETTFVGGRFVEEFEERYADLYGINHCVGVANGTDALFIALKSLEIGPGDEVITVANSWISTSSAITQTGANPVFVDIEPDYFTIDSSRIEEKITNRTKAILPVHLFGHPSDLDPIILLCEKYNLKLVEDCAQAHLAEYRGKKVGLFGDISTFSFYPGKNLGAYGDAGCIITSDSDLAERCRRFAHHGALEKHDHLIEGVNSRLDSIQAAILKVKLKYLNQWTEARRSLANYYKEILGSIDFVELPKEAAYGKHVYHLYVVRMEDRDSIKQKLNENDVGVSIHYPTPLPLLPAYKRFGYSKNDFPIAYQYSKQILSLPMYPELTAEAQKSISDYLRNVKLSF